MQISNFQGLKNFFRSAILTVLMSAGTVSGVPHGMLTKAEAEFMNSIDDPGPRWCNAAGDLQPTLEIGCL